MSMSFSRSHVVKVMMSIVIILLVEISLVVLLMITPHLELSSVFGFS